MDINKGLQETRSRSEFQEYAESEVLDMTRDCNGLQTVVQSLLASYLTRLSEV